VQEGATLVIKLADPCNFVVVVEDFSRKEVDFAREQYAHNQGVNPVLVPKYSRTSHLSGFALSYWFGLNLPA
jgi:hypothetical protein